jgi:hypothetical protein
MVAERFVLLVLVCELADSVILEVAGKRELAIAQRKETLDRLLGLGFTPLDLEVAERSFVMSLRTGKVDRDAAIGAMWRLECAGVLAWALGLEPAILPVDQHAELAPLKARLPADAAALRRFVDSATMRPLGSLMSARSEWQMRWFPLEVTEPSEKRSRVLERMRAIRWLTEPALAELSATQVLAGR